MDIEVHPRISLRHPEITEADVKAAVHSIVLFKHRMSDEWLAIGYDGKGGH